MAPSPSSTGRPKLVCVDPAVARRAVLERCAGRELDIIAVADGRDALAALDSREVAVLVIPMRGLDAEALLRAAHERSPRTFRIVTSEQADIDRMLEWRDEGLVASYLVSPWREDELQQLLRWGCDAWTLAADVVALPRPPASPPGAAAADLLHDLKSPLMTILANADHLDSLAASVPALNEVLADLPIPLEHRRLLAQILDDLQPISEELTTATRRVGQLVEQLHAVGEDNSEPRRTRRTGSK